MRKVILAVIFASLALYGYGAIAQSYYSGQANGVAQYQNIQALTPIPYGQVRICTLPASGSPCTPLASGITDKFGNPVTVLGGGFGQIQTDVTGAFTFGCVIGNYEVQIAPTVSNIPQKQFNVTCPSTLNPSTSVGVINSQGPGNSVTGTGSYQVFYTYNLVPNVISASGGLEIECDLVPSGAATSILIQIDNTPIMATPWAMSTANPGTLRAVMQFYNNGSSSAQWFTFTGLNGVGNTYMDSGTGVFNMAVAHVLTCQVQQDISGSVHGAGFIVNHSAL